MVTSNISVPTGIMITESKANNGAKPPPLAEL